METCKDVTSVLHLQCFNGISSTHNVGSFLSHGRKLFTEGAVSCDGGDDEWGGSDGGDGGGGGGGCVEVVVVLTGSGVWRW